MKRKAPAFAEAKFHEGTRGDAHAMAAASGGVADPFSLLQDLVPVFVTHNRLDAVLSKVRTGVCLWCVGLEHGRMRCVRRWWWFRVCVCVCVCVCVLV